MARWPNVPAAHGWLRLDRRGGWRLVDRGRAGFDPRRDGAGSPITNATIVAFIARNYLADADGAWYWQNGPQRVYVDLDLAPLVLRVLTGRAGAGGEAPAEAAAPCLVTHCGDAALPLGVLVDAQGTMYVDTDRGPGAIHDLDLAALDIELDDAPDETARPPDGRPVGTLRWGPALLPVVFVEDPARALGFVRRPRPHAGRD